MNFDEIQNGMSLIKLKNQNPKHMDENCHISDWVQAFLMYSDLNFVYFIIQKIKDFVYIYLLFFNNLNFVYDLAFS